MTQEQAKKRFWISIITGAITAFVVALFFCYINFFEIISYLFITPFISGFVSIAVSTHFHQKDIASNIMIPWASLLLLLLLPFYWKLRLLILLAIPIASIGGLCAGAVMIRFRQLTGEEDEED